MRNFKRILCAALVAIMLTGSVSVTAFAADTKTTSTVATVKTDESLSRLQKALQGKYYYTRTGKEYSITFGAKNTFTFVYYSDSKEYKGSIR